MGGYCDVQWLDPEPYDDDDGNIETYRHEWAQLQKDSEKSLFRGFVDPPTPEEYEALCRIK